MMSISRASDPKMRPVHPGEIIREAIEEGLHLPFSTAAAQLRTSRHHLHEVMAGQHAVSPEMALKLGRRFGTGPDIWLALQADYDLRKARERLGADLEKIPEYA